MPKVRSFQTNFIGGMLDPLMAARSDTKMYVNGARDLTNSAILVTGGAVRRPGTLYRATLGADGRLFGFIFSEDQTYLWHFKDLQIKVYSLAGSLIATITTPWSLAEVPYLRWAQAGDTVIITHPDYEPRRILRTGATTFTIATFPWENIAAARPYYKHAANSVSLAFSAASGSGVTCTASAAAFTAGMVGQNLKVIDETGSDDVIVYAEITGFTDTTHVTVTLSDTLTTAAGPHLNWLEWAYSSAKGWPAACAFHAQRLLLGGGNTLPASIFGTNIGEYFNFDLGDGLDDEGVAYTIALSIGSKSAVHEIRHLVSTKHLLVLTDQAELFVPESDTRPFTPGNFGVRLQTPYGSSHVPPQVFDLGTLFVQNAGRAVREMFYEDFQQIYTANAITLSFSSHLGSIRDSGIIYGNRDKPEQYAFFVNEDGEMAVFLGVRAEKIAAWTLWTTDGEFRAVTSINDRLFALVKRTINGSDAYYLEEFSWDATVDCAVEVSGASSASWSGLSHLIGETVYGVNGNLSWGTSLVTALGAVTFGEEATELTIGLNYTRTIETLPPAVMLPEGTTIGELKRIVKTALILDSAAHVLVRGSELLIRQVTDDLSEDPEPVTGIRVFYHRGWDREGVVEITQEDPLPCGVLGMAVEMIV